MAVESLSVKVPLRILLFFVGALSLMQCSDSESSSIEDPIENPSGEVDSNNNPTNSDFKLETSDYYELYNHTNIITEFAYSNGNIAIADEAGLTLVIGDAKYFYSEINYEISGNLFTAQMQNITGLEFTSEGLYIATDRHFVLYDDDDQKFFGQPVKVHLIKKVGNQGKIQGLWEWYLTDDLVGIYRTEMELDEEEFLVDGGPCLDFFNPEVNYCEEFELSNFSDLDPNAMIGLQGELLLLPDYANQTVFEYRDFFSFHSFSKIFEVQFMFMADLRTPAPDRSWWDYAWYITDRGLARSRNITMNEVFGFEDWKEFEISDNGVDLLGLQGLMYYTNESLLAYRSNQVCYVEYSEELICVLELTGISDISGIFISGGDVFFSHGNRISIVDYQNLYDKCGF